MSGHYIVMMSLATTWPRLPVLAGRHLHLPPSSVTLGRVWLEGAEIGRDKREMERGKREVYSYIIQ